MAPLNDEPLVHARGLHLAYGRKTALDGLDFEIRPGRVVGLLGHNGAGKTTLMKALVGLIEPAGTLQVLGLRPRQQRVALLRQLSYIPDVAILPRWARVHELIRLMTSLHPGFSAERARQLIRRTSVALDDKVKSLSKGMVAQVHLALVAAIHARLLVLDEPTLGLDVPSRKAFYEMLLDEWCNGARSVLISTHQVEEVEGLLTDVLMLNEGKLVLNTSLEAIDHRFVALAHDAAASEVVAAAHPLLRYRLPTHSGGGSAALFDGEPPPAVAALGQRVRPSLVDLFMALTRAPELHRTSA
jgi:ABC-2 type transport system ATP-binding protein